MRQIGLPVQGHGERSGGTVGLTDHTPPDLNGTVTLLQLALQIAGKDKKSLSGVWGEAPGFVFGVAGSDNDSHALVTRGNQSS